MNDSSNEILVEGTSRYIFVMQCLHYGLSTICATLYCVGTLACVTEGEVPQTRPGTADNSVRSSSNHVPTASFLTSSRADDSNFFCCCKRRCKGFTLALADKYFFVFVSSSSLSDAALWMEQKQK